MFVGYSFAFPVFYFFNYSWESLYIYSSTEIFNLDSMEWRDGPEFPFDMAAGSSVPYGDSFLVSFVG